MHDHGFDDAAWASPWRRRAVGDKVLLSVGLVLVALVTPAWPTSLLIVLVVMALMLGPGRLHPKMVVLSALAPATFLLIGGIPIAIELGDNPIGTVIASLGPINITKEGLLKAIDVAAHGVSGTMSLMLLAVTTPMVDLLAAMRRIGIPAPAVDISMLMYQMIFGLAGTVATIGEAQAARLGHSTWKRTIHSSSALMGTAFVRSIDSAMRKSEGLAGRGYVNDLTTLGVKLHHSPRFVAASFLLIAVLLAIGLASNYVMAGG
ncbi:cobalt ECF transporter T component CbiQ [Stomatohabitans albus]|uniref:cobalt ECF transporter T component CbiQ n=1 Tax=Stomatohabitans albus TaxID=3110766 RepID=UPI00300D5004